MGETAIVTYSDVHLGRVTATYDPDQFRAYMGVLSRKLHLFARLLASSNVEELLLCVLGDVVDGAGIFPSQAHGQAITDEDEQGREWATFTAGWLRELRGSWPKISVACVAGNHGRRGKDRSVRANADLNAYYFLKEKLGGEIAVSIPEKDEHPSLRLLTVNGHKYVICHGDGSGLAWTTIERRVLLLNATRRYRGFDVYVQGHAHQSWHRPVNDIDTFGSGTWVTSDEYVLRSGREESPTFWLFGSSPDRPVTFSYDLDCVHG